MFKKYLPYIFLVGAAGLLWFVKKNQRGGNRDKQISINDNYTKKTNTNTNSVTDIDELDRNTTSLIYTKHAHCRMDCRHIDESEVKEILAVGEVNYAKVEKDDRGKTYPLEGITHDKQHVRIVFAPKKEKLVVVTVIDLDNDWPCNCK
jgi:Domain of unknown function (DUF4258)